MVVVTSRTRRGCHLGSSGSHSVNKTSAMTDSFKATSRGKPASNHHRWHLDFVDDSTNVSYGRTVQRSTAAREVIDEFFHPPGFPSSYSARDPSSFATITSNATVGCRPFRAGGSNGDGDTIKAPPNNAVEEERSAMAAAYRQSWTTAFSPLRAMLTSMLALYLAGSRVQFFSIASTVTVLFTHTSSLLATVDVFRVVRRTYPLLWRTLAPQLVVHVCLCVFGIAIGLYKADQLGFLPVTESDWIGLLPSYSVAPMTFRHTPALH